MLKNRARQKLRYSVNEALRFIAAIQSDARQDLAEQVAKMEAQLKEAVEIIKNATYVYSPYGDRKTKFLAILDQREGKGRKTN